MKVLSWLLLFFPVSEHSTPHSYRHPTDDPLTFRYHPVLPEEFSTSSVVGHCLPLLLTIANAAQDKPLWQRCRPFHKQSFFARAAAAQPLSPAAFLYKNILNARFDLMVAHRSESLLTVAEMRCGFEERPGQQGCRPSEEEDTERKTRTD